MTPHALYTLLGLGVLAVVALVVLGVGTARIPRVGKAADEGRPRPALVWLIVAGLILYAVSSPAGAPHSAGWEHEPIPCAEDCGWNYYFVIVIGALRLIAITAVGLVGAFAAAVLWSIQAWLDNPADTDGANITNRQRLARRWRIWRRERVLTRALAAHPATGKGVRIDQSRDVFPTSASTSFWLQPAPDAVDDLVATLTGDPVVESVSVHHGTETVELRVNWDLARVDVLEYTRVPVSMRIACGSGRRSVFLVADWLGGGPNMADFNSHSAQIAPQQPMAFPNLTTGNEIASPIGELLSITPSDCTEHWPIVTICGSMRFYQQMLTVAEELTLDGFIVLMPFVRKEPFMEADVNHPGNVIERLDAQHKRKIDFATSIVVVSDDSGYYGDSTRSEIDYAQSQRKTITYRRVALKHTCAGHPSDVCTACTAAKQRSQT